MAVNLKGSKIQLLSGGSPQTARSAEDAEFIDGNGTKWDIKSFDSRFPPRKGGFSLQRDLGKVKEELDKGENVILNTENLSAQHAQDLRGAVDALEPALKSRIMWFP
jgi:hypothetical protein